MKLYQLADGTFVGTQDEGRKSKQTFVQVDVATDKEGLIAYLNAGRPKLQGGDQNTIVRDGYGDPVQGVVRDFRVLDDYISPLSARSTIAGIDAVMVSQAVEQMQGEELAKVVSASIKRMNQLTKDLDSYMQTKAIIGDGLDDLLS